MLLALSVAAALAPGRGLRAVGLALDVALALACVVDRLRTPDPRALDVRRSLPPSAGLGERFERLARVAAPAAEGLRLELREEFAAPFEVVARTLDGRAGAPPAPGDPTGGPDTVRLPAGGRADLVRAYRARVRGRHGLGDLRLRVTGPLGLVTRQGRLFGDQAIAIEPPLLNLRQTLRLAASERWHDLGVRRLRRRGGMTAFESLREYVHGDDVRLVDWKAFAKRGRPIVREFTQERGQELLVLVDCGRRMGATAAEGAERGWTKLDHALDAGLQVAAVALEHGDRVGLVAFDRAVRLFVPPRRGRHQLARLKEAAFDLAASELESDLGRALRELETRHARRALLLLLSDVEDPLSVDRQRRVLAASRRRHRIVFAALDDPAVRHAAEEAPAAGERDEREGRDERVGLRGAAFAIVEERREGLARLARSGVRVLDTLPAEAAGPLLAAWLDERRAY